MTVNRTIWDRIEGYFLDRFGPAKEEVSKCRQTRWEKITYSFASLASGRPASMATPSLSCGLKRRAHNRATDNISEDFFSIGKSVGTRSGTCFCVL